MEIPLIKYVRLRIPRGGPMKTDLMILAPIAVLLACVLLAVGVQHMLRGGNPSPKPTGGPKWVVDNLVTFDTARAGCLILGEPGSGKTTTIGREIRRNLLRSGMGGMVLMCKVNEWENLYKDCKATGRLDDLVHFRPGGTECCDFLEVILNSPGGTPMLATSMLATVSDMEARKSGGGGGGNDKYWNEMLTKSMNAAITICWLANGKVTIADIYRFYTDAATTPQQFNDPAWRARSPVWEVLYRGSKVHSNNSDWNLAATFWVVEWPGLDVKPQSICTSVTTNLLIKFLSSDIRGLISGKTTHSPFDTLKGKILGVDMPITRHQERGVMYANIMKLLMHHVGLSRDITPGMPDLFLFMDEFQNFLSPTQDIHVASIAREYRLTVVSMAQNLPILYQALGGSQQAIHSVDGLFSCQGTKIALANSCATTGAYLGKIFGASWHDVWNESFQPMGGYSPTADAMGYSQQGGGMSMSRHQQWKDDVNISDFTRLNKPVRGRPYAEGFLFMGGHIFGNNKPWIKTTFPRID